MKVEISVPEVANLFKEIQEQPNRLFEMIRVDVRESVGHYMSKPMSLELTLSGNWYRIYYNSVKPN